MKLPGWPKKTTSGSHASLEYIHTLQETNISHLGKRKIIFKHASSGGFVSSLEGIIRVQKQNHHQIKQRTTNHPKSHRKQKKLRNDLRTNGPEIGLLIVIKGLSLASFEHGNLTPQCHVSNRKYLEDHPRTDVYGLGYVVNNHGDRFRPNSWGCGTSSKWPFHGLILSTYDTWDDPASSRPSGLGNQLACPEIIRRYCGGEHLEGKNKPEICHLVLVEFLVKRD